MRRNGIAVRRWNRPDMTGPAPARPARALVLSNPKARRGDAEIAPVVARLEAGGIAVRREAFTGPDEVEADILRGAGWADCIVVCGGDGTLNAAIPAMLKTGLPLGILPMGTANDLARTLGIPENLNAAADVILAGHRRVIDIGWVNEHAFFNVASIGLSVDLTRELSSGLKKRWGRLGYALAGWRVLRRARRFSAWITEGEVTTRVKTVQIAVGNGRHYGGGNVVEETAEIDDGHLDLYSLELSNVWQLALGLRTFRSGTHGAWDEVRTARGTEFEIRTREPREVNADGEIVTETPAVFRIQPKALTVLAPRPRGRDGG
jgi:YegS/Rv2252/BmrU family lipid kinase